MEAFTLIEVMIALAVAAIAILLAAGLMDYSAMFVRRADHRNTQNDLLTSLRTLVTRAAPVVRREEYLTFRTFFRQVPVDPVRKVAAVAKERSLVVFGSGKDKKTFRRDSFTLDLTDFANRRAGTVEGLIMTRCIKKKNANKTLSMKRLMQLKKYPVITKWSSDPDNPKRRIPEISCCFVSKTTTPADCKGVPVGDAKSEWRVRTYQITKSGVVVYPRGEELKGASSAGFFATFDSRIDPLRFTATVFVIDNECQRVEDTGINPEDRMACKPKPRFLVKQVNKDVEKEIHSSGIINLGN